MKNNSYHLGYLAYLILIITLFFIILSQNAQGWLVMVPLILAFIPIFIDAIKNLFEKKITTEIFLIFATVIGLAAHQEQAITVVLLIMMIAKYLERLIEEKTGKAIASLITLVPTKVTVKTDLQELVVPLEDVLPGMKIIIKTGEQIPVDGTIISGQASINESFLTGESIPQDKTISEPVFAGTFVEGGSIVVLTQNTGQDTHFGKINKLLEQAEKQKAKIITVSNKAALIIVQVLVVFIALVWLVTHDLSMVATLLIFGSPIELTLITPMAILSGTAAAFRYGILIKGSVALERFWSIDTLIFDKTGTLTMGQPKVMSIESCDNNYSQDDILRLAAIIEKGSGHILAKVILQKAYEQNLSVPDPETYESVTGHGVIATYNNQRYLLGSKHFIQDREHGNTPIPVSLLDNQAKSPFTTFYLACEQKVCGKICLSDTIRPEAKNTIDLLRTSGIKNIMLLSGDKLEVAHDIAAQLGIDRKNVYGEIAPDKKLTIIRDLQKQGHKVGMVGDGINDAPALKQADVGIAMGAMGMEPAIEAADIVLMANNLHSIVFVRALSKKIFSVIMQNIFCGFVLIHLLGIILTLLGLVSAIQAALFHAISDILILLNSARLMRFRLKN